VRRSRVQVQHARARSAGAAHGPLVTRKMTGHRVATPTQAHGLCVFAPDMSTQGVRELHSMCTGAARPLVVQGLCHKRQLCGLCQASKQLATGVRRDRLPACPSCGSASEQVRGARSALALHGQQLREAAPRLCRRSQARPSPPAARARAGVPQAPVRRGQQRRAARHGPGLQARRASHACAARQPCHALAKRAARRQVLSCTEHELLPRPRNRSCAATLFTMLYYVSGSFEG